MGNIGIVGAILKSIVRIPGLNRKAGKLEPIDEESLLGNCYNCCQFGGDPVNMATGNFIYEREYLIIKGLFPLSFKLHYNALGRGIGTVGRGWVHNFDMSIALDTENNKAVLCFEDGRQETFFRDGAGHYHQSQGFDSQLRDNDSTYIYTAHDGVEYTFGMSSAQGRLIRIEDRNSNCVVLAYDKHGRLLKAVNNSGSEFVFSYDNCKTDLGKQDFDRTRPSKLRQVSDNCGRSVTLEYQGDVLACITDEEGGRFEFTYDSQERISEIVNPMGVGILKNEYDGGGRIKRQEFPDGGVITYKYDGEENTLVLREQNGNEISYIHDGKFRSVATVFADGTEKYRYNSQNQRILFIDKNGNETKYSYDVRNNLTQIINPLGELTEIGYNHNNKPVSIVVCGSEILKLGYDNSANAVEVSDAIGRTSKTEYNTNGQPIKIIQPDGNEIDIVYDIRGNILSVTESGAGSVTKYEYDNLNRVICVIDGNGNKTSFEYNFKGDITRVVNALGHFRKYEYNSIGKLTKIIDFDGSSIIWGCNCIGKPSKIIDQDGNETCLEYDIMWNISKMIDANGNTTRFEYNRLNRLVKVADAEGAETLYKYDPNGNKTKVCGARGNDRIISYDPLNRINEVEDASGAKTRIEYDKMENIAKTIDALGNICSFGYDAAGQKISEIDKCGFELKYKYNLLGQISEISDSAGRTTKYSYLPGGLLKIALYYDGRSIEYKYDACKNLVSQTMQDGYTLLYKYDCMNRIVEISSNSGQNMKYHYDPVGNVNAVTDANGNISKYAYSPTGYLIASIDPLGNRAEFCYDKMHKMVEARQLGDFREAQSSNTLNSPLRLTKFERNKLGQVVRVVDALGNTEEYDYDKSGNVIRKIDKDGYLTKYDYNLSNQLKNITYADGKSVDLSYNSLKHLTEIKDWLGITSIESNELGYATKVMDSNGRKVEYSYGLDGKRTSIKYPDGKVVVYQYDEALRLKTLIDGDLKVKYSYDNNSRLSDKLFSNGLNTKYTYNDMGLLAELTHIDKEGVLDKYVYTYDNMINTVGIMKFRRGLPEESGNYQYTYDALSRLTGVLKDGVEKKSYVYDEYGNRSVMFIDGVRTNYSYNSLNQLLRLENNKNMVEFCYDARGNLTQEIENGKISNTYEFSALNRLVKVANAEGQTAKYEYNGLGFRAGMEISDNLGHMREIKYLSDLTKPCHNILQISDDIETRNYTWDSNVLAEMSETGKRYYLQDELGSPLRNLDEECAQVERYGYDEFGNDIYQNQGMTQPLGSIGMTQPFGSKGMTQPFGFTGYIMDSVSHKYFVNAREYSPSIGRFISHDFIYDGLNCYLHCYNNPLRFVDRNGLWGQDIHEGDENDGTIKWAIDAGFTPNQARIIGSANIGVDFSLGTSPVNVFGGQKYHFNRADGGARDTRLELSDKHFNEAVKIVNDAKQRREEDINNISFGFWDNIVGTTYEKKMETINKRYNNSIEKALKELGKGLHPLQDIDAHGNIGVGDVIASHTDKMEVDEREYDWIDDVAMLDVVQSDVQARYNKTMKKTGDYFNKFFERVGCL